MSDALPLPPRPDLEQYKKLARDFKNACGSDDPTAIRRHALHWLEALAKLHHPSSPLLHDPGSPLCGVGRDREAERMEERWRRLTETTGHAESCTLAVAQLFIAREHGFQSWPKFARHVRELGVANSSVSAFEAAADAIANGDASALRALLAAHPGLSRERSTRDHHSTLLHYVSANGIEDFRQKTPRNIVEVTNQLLDAGADVNAESDAYGGGCTTLGLVATSVHPEEAGVQIALLQALLDRGAIFDRPSEAGNRHSIVHGCLANGQPEAARFFADRGARLDLVGAAGLGRVEVLRSVLDNGDNQTPPDPKEIDSAFLYACGYGSIESARFLLQRGVNPAAHDSSGQTALHWACWTPHPDVIALLIEHGASVDARDDRFHATPLDTALWTWNKADSEDARGRCYDAISLLVRAGATFDPKRWEKDSALLQKLNSDSRMQAALRGEIKS